MRLKIFKGKKGLAGLVALIILLSILTLTGCGVERRPGPTQPTPAPAPAPYPAPLEDNNMMDNQKSQIIAQKIGNLDSVNSATVVLANGSAWVGIDMKASTTTPTMTDEIKNQVTQLVKTEDQSIQTVYVTADADTVTRLKNIAQGLASGRPVSGFVQELGEIGRRITPSAR